MKRDPPCALFQRPLIFTLALWQLESAKQLLLSLTNARGLSTERDCIAIEFLQQPATILATRFYIIFFTPHAHKFFFMKKNVSSEDEN